MKRVSLYFNEENPLEQRMWEYICKDGKKSYTIKKAIQEAMEGNRIFIPTTTPPVDDNIVLLTNTVVSDEDEVLDLGDDDPFV